MAPDNIIKPSDELIKLTKKNYQKISGSRVIAPYLDLADNKSKSFIVLLDGIRKLINEGK
jgi:hypothetical protein